MGQTRPHGARGHPPPAMAHAPVHPRFCAAWFYGVFGRVPHSFTSYRLAAVPNTAQVALEAGNSPQMIFRHYRELVRAMDAERWFGITPEAVEATKTARESGAAGKIVALPMVGA